MTDPLTHSFLVLDVEGSRTRDNVQRQTVRKDFYAVPHLLDRIGTLERRALNGQPPPAGELDALSDEITKADKTARQRCEQATAPIDQRNQLRKRLECYHEMAGKLQLELPEIDKLYREAHQLLWTKPCKLDAATKAVDAYQQSVIAERDKRR